MHGMEEFPRFSQASFHTTTPETKFETRYEGPSVYFAPWQTAMTPYLVPIARARANPLPSPPLTPTPPDRILRSLPGALPTCLMRPTLMWFPTASPDVFSEVGDDFCYSGTTTRSLDFPLLPLRMDAKFWESTSLSDDEAPPVEILRAPQFEFEYEEYSDEDSEVYEKKNSHISEDDRYYGSGRGTSSVEDFDEGRTPPERLPNPWEGSLATLTATSYDSPSNIESLSNSGFITVKRPLVQLRQDYEHWLNSQAKSSSSPDIPEIHSPIPRRLVQLDRFNL